MKYIYSILLLLIFAAIGKAQHWTNDQFLPDSLNSIYSATIGSEFGWSMAATNDHVIVGTLQEKAVIYQRFKVGGALEAQALLEPTVGGFNGFGMRVDIDDTTAIVGAPFYMNTGGVFVYTFNISSQTWAFQQTLVPSDGAASDRFGEAIAISGSNIIVGSRGHNSAEGAAYLFTRVGSVWAEADKITPAGTNSGDSFGSAVDIVGDTAVCSSPAHYNGTPGHTGTAYILSVTGGLFSVLQTIIAAADQWDGSDNFGNSVCLSESKQVFVGASTSSQSGVDAGAVFGWYLDGATWSPFAPLVPNNPQSGERFGTSISTKDGDIAIGAPGFNSSIGRIILGHLLTDLYFQIQAIIGSNIGFGPSFGQSTAFMQSTVLSGSNYGATYHGNSDTGKVDEYEECDEEIDGNIFWDNVTLTSQEASADSYNWYRVDDSSFPFPVTIPVGTGITHQPQTPGRYVLVLEKNGCFRHTVVVVLAVGVEELDDVKFTIQPNPVTENLFFSTELRKGSLEIITVDGKVVKSEKLVGQRMVDVSELEAGVYIIRLSGTDRQGQQRFVKAQ